LGGIPVVASNGGGQTIRAAAFATHVDDARPAALPQLSQELFGGDDVTTAHPLLSSLKKKLSRQSLGRIDLAVRGACRPRVYQTVEPLIHDCQSARLGYDGDC
jgi:hypothetical protein